MPRMHLSANRLQQVAGDDRQHHVELEVAHRTAPRDRGVVSDHLGHDLLHGLGDDRIDLARHDRRSRLQIGDVDLGEPRVRAAPHPSDVGGDLVERDGDHTTHAGCLDQRIASTLRFEVVTRLGERQPHVGGDLGDDTLREPARAVDARADRRASDGQLADSRQHTHDPLDAVLDGLRVAAELLAERDRRRVHEVGAPGLDHRAEPALLPAQLLRQLLERGDQVLRQLPSRREVDR